LYLFASFFATESEISSILSRIESVGAIHLRFKKQTDTGVADATPEGN
jgi:hypothetical protein